VKRWWVVKFVRVQWLFNKLILKIRFGLSFSVDVFIIQVPEQHKHNQLCNIWYLLTMSLPFFATLSLNPRRCGFHKHLSLFPHSISPPCYNWPLILSTSNRASLYTQYMAECVGIAIILLTCIREIQGSHLCPNTGNP
jgi:hypothetical protein